MALHVLPAAHPLPGRALSLLAATLLAAPLLLVGHPPAEALEVGPTLSFDESAFLASQPIVTTENFEGFATPTEFPPAQRRVFFQSVRYRSIEDTPPSWAIDVDPADVLTDDHLLLRRFNRGSATGPLRAAIAFRDGGSVRAVGFRLEPFATLSPNQFELIVTEANGNSTTFLLPRDIDDTYIGLSSPNRIKRAVVTQHPEVTGSLVNFGFDDVSRGRIAPAH